MEYNFRAIEKKWQQQWNEDKAYQVPNNSPKPKYYVLDMFPYPSGAGLHVGHPLGYIASDIFARYKRLKGFNVLHPMGYDAFGLPAEQYAIEHGVHPAQSTEKNIATFRKQLDNIGFSFDWSREVRTSDPGYYKWTQRIFLQLFGSWYNRKTAKTESINTLIEAFKWAGNTEHPIPSSHFQIPGTNTNTFTAEEWNRFNEATQQTILMEYRIAYCGYGEVNWCEALGTVLANDEVVNGVSERGGYPVEKKRLRQWYLRITEYADRLLQGLQTVDFSDAMKEMQSNWIGKSVGAEIWFDLLPTSSKGGGAEPLTKESPGWNTANSTYASIKDFRKELKDNPTEAESVLWEALRNKKLGAKFRRQHVIGGYITDFVALEKKLIIEVDGKIHEAQKEEDDYRTSKLLEAGFEVIRFKNEEVFGNIENVIEQIKQKLNSITAKETGTIKVPSFGGDLGKVAVYTTRPDTIFGVDFMVIAPEHELVEEITTEEQKKAVEDYIVYVKSRSERERMAEKKISGVFTGSYAINPFNGKQIPVWISEYVLAGYGTGAIMAVPSGDERDHKFAKHFGIPITNIFGAAYNGEEAVTSKSLILENSDFLTGTNYDGATEIVLKKLEELGAGRRKVNFKMRDAAFSRQRYWGEPFPIVWKDGIAYPLDEKELPLELPHVESYGPGPEGEGPLANIPDWYLIPDPSPLMEKGETATAAQTPLSTSGEGLGVRSMRRETNTMPGYAGSSWYFLRYMDPHNNETFCDKTVGTYWNQVDLYVGGTEHAVGHLLYSRMWTKALYDLGLISFDEPFKRLLNQGMIQGSSRFVYRLEVFGTSTTLEGPLFISKKHFDYLPNLMSSVRHAFKYINTLIPNAISINNSALDSSIRVSPIHIDVNIVDGVELDIEAFRNSKEEYKNAVFILEDGSVNTPLSTRGEGPGVRYICGTEVEKMSKSKYNTVNPDSIVESYGADTFRMYEMFLGPVEMSKPWDTKGIEGVHRFLKKLWRLFYTDEKIIITAEAPTAAELKVLHKTIKKIEEDTERFSFNTCISAFMVCVNELTDLGCRKKEILAPLLILLTPYAPHIAEELWQTLKVSPFGGDLEGSVLDATFPTWEEKNITESTKEYPISVNGKLRTTINIDLSLEQTQVQEIVLQNSVVQKWLEGREPKKIIFVKGKMVNVVV